MQHSLLISKLTLEAESAQQLFCRELHEIGFHGRAAAHKTKIAMPSVGWCGVKLSAIGLWSSGNAFSGVMNDPSPSSSLTDESGFGGCQENTTCPNA
jgi:hypothetical protein